MIAYILLGRVGPSNYHAERMAWYPRLMSYLSWITFSLLSSLDRASLSQFHAHIVP